MTRSVLVGLVFVALNLSVATPARADLQADISAIAPLSERYSDCFSSSFPEGHTREQWVARQVRACDGYIAAVNNLWEPHRSNRAAANVFWPVVSKAIRIKGKTQIDAGQSDVGLQTLLRGVVDLRTAAASGHTLPYAFSSELVFEAIGALSNQGRAAEAEVLLTEIRKLMDDIDRSFPATEALLPYQRMLRRDGWIYESEVAKSLTGDQRLVALQRSEHWAFKRQQLLPKEPFIELGSVVVGLRRRMEQVQSGDDQRRSIAASLIARCAQDQYPNLDLVDGGRARVKQCIVNNEFSLPDINVGDTFQGVDGRVYNFELVFESDANKAAPVLDEVMDHTRPGIEDAVPR